MGHINKTIPSMNGKVCLATGKYYYNYREAKASKNSRDIAIRKHLWEETERILNGLGY